jgi:hypothetical protein
MKIPRVKNKLPDPYESDSFPRWMIVWGVPAIILAAVLILLIRDPGTDGLIPCTFFGLTGYYCTGCGATRALHALLHGRFTEALSFNLFLLIWMPVPGYALLEYWLRRLLRKPVLPKIKGWRWIFIMMAVSALIFLVLRNLDFKPFNWLAP